jgi:hypothetical protein
MKAAEEKKKEFRYFDTSTGTAHNDQDMTANVVGRKVMRTQDGSLVGMESRDQ